MNLRRGQIIEFLLTCQTFDLCPGSMGSLLHGSKQSSDMMKTVFSFHLIWFHSQALSFSG